MLRFENTHASGILVSCGIHHTRQLLEMLGRLSSLNVTKVWQWIVFHSDEGSYAAFA